MLITKQFLDICRMILPVIDKFGVAMAILKSDIEVNMKRLDARYMADISHYYVLYDIVRKEIEEKTTNNPNSCTNALLWMTRGMDFFMALFQNILEHPEWTMSQATIESYNLTLKKWHGWVTSSAFMVALQLIPNRAKCAALLREGNSEVEIKNFVISFSPLLEESHEFLKSVGIDDVKAS